MSEEIRGCLLEADSCFRLLLPFDLGPCLGAAPPATARAVPAEGTPHPAGTADPGDEEQPCCSKTLPGCARPAGAPSGKGPSQACPGTSSEEDEDEDEEEEDDSDPEEFVRHHGLGSHKYTLDVELRSGDAAPAAAWGPHCHHPRLLLCRPPGPQPSGRFPQTPRGHGWGRDSSGCGEAVGPQALPCGPHCDLRVRRPGGGGSLVPGVPWELLEWLWAAALCPGPECGHQGLGITCSGLEWRGFSRRP